MDGHCLSLYTYKRCIVFKQFDGLILTVQLESIKNVKISSHQNFVLYSRLCTIHYMQPLALILPSKSVSKYINRMILVIVAVLSCQCFLSVSASAHCVIIFVFSYNGIYQCCVHQHNRVVEMRLVNLLCCHHGVRMSGSYSLWLHPIMVVI